MSGHSKWATIKHKKGAADQKRAKLFAKLIKQVNNINDAYEQIMARRRKEAEAAAKKAIEEFTETKPQKTAVH